MKDSTLGRRELLLGSAAVIAAPVIPCPASISIEGKPAWLGESGQPCASMARLW